jgi:hypothetical protein
VEETINCSRGSLFQRADLVLEPDELHAFQGPHLSVQAVVQLITVRVRPPQLKKVIPLEIGDRQVNDLRTSVARGGGGATRVSHIEDDLWSPGME